MNLTNEVLDAIEIIVNDKIKKAGFNRTRNGRITQVNSNGSYSVLID